MRKILSVARREYVASVKTIGFMVGILMAPVLVTGTVLIAPRFLGKFAQHQPQNESVRDQPAPQKTKNLAVVDLSGEVYTELQSRMDQRNQGAKQKYILQEWETEPESIDEARSRLSTEVAAGRLDAYVIIGEDIIADGAGSRFFSRNITDTDMLRTVRNNLNGVVVNKRFIRNGVNPELVAKLQHGITVEHIDVSEKGEEKKAQVAATMVTAYAFIFLLFMAIFAVGGQGMLNSVIEEKSGRIFEVLLSSLSPFQLMAGKIAGIGAVSLTVVGAWVISGYLGVTYMGYGNLISLGDASYFFIYFVLGFLLLSSVMAAVGSACNTMKDAQGLVMPLTLLMMTPLFIWFRIAQHPHSLLAIVLSYVPPMTPFIMMIRLSVSQISIMEILISVALLAASVVLAMWASSRIFRVGVLMYGKAPRIPELVKWLGHN